MSILATLHALAALLLGVYAFHQGILLVLYLRHRHAKPTTVSKDFIATTHSLANATDGALGGALGGELLDIPSITVQIPIYNERYVTERIIQALKAQDYPRTHLHVQILDDSTDETTQIAQDAVHAAGEQGLSITLLHRNNRVGYKAGALAAGLLQTDSDFIAVFDADFVPAPDFLRRLMLTRRRELFDNPKVGFVQTRWGYLNRDQNSATRSQALMLDMHFIVEQPARNSSGLFMSFNGSGGVWRRRCIEDAGGWQHDTLTEDLDLCYRAQLLGWRGMYLADEMAPGELPPTIMAFKRQQARWSRGTLQCVRKLMPKVLHAPLTLSQKVAAWMHLSGYIIHPLILLMAITTPLLLIRSLIGDPSARLPVWLNFFSVVSLAPIVAMAFGAHRQKRSLGQFLYDLPGTMLLGIGVAFSNTIAMGAALFVRGSGEFLRTPKTATLTASAAPKTKAIRQPHEHAFASYAARPNWTMWIELGLAVYGLGAMVLLLNLGYWWSAVPTLLYACGFGIVGVSQLLADWLEN